MCPYSLDGELPHVPEGARGNELPFWPIGAVFKLRRGRWAEHSAHGLWKLSSDIRPQGPDAGPVDIRDFSLERR